VVTTQSALAKSDALQMETQKQIRDWQDGWKTEIEASHKRIADDSKVLMEHEDRMEKRMDKVDEVHGKMMDQGKQYIETGQETVRLLKQMQQTEAAKPKPGGG
jgi:hypothetical protein